MLKHPEITERRVRQFVQTLLLPNIETDSAELSVEFCETAHPDQRAAERGEFRPVGKGFKWGPVWRSVWFRASGEVPKEWAGRDVVAHLEVGGERTVWQDGVPMRGIDGQHPRFPVVLGAKGKEKVKIYIEATGTNPDVLVHGHFVEPEKKPFAVGDVSLRLFDKPLWDFYLDCAFFLSLLETMPQGDVARAHILRGLNEAANRFSVEDRATLVDAAKALHEWTASKRVDRYHSLTAVGHAHLDTAWLWPLAVTKKKMAHTAATQVALMKKYPEYVFAHSQASQYEWLEKEYPELFLRVKKMIAAGQWEPLGSMWVEADTNLAGGEALVRQFLYGKRYFKEKLGVETTDMWLPDVFGYSAAVPQILSKLGIEYFLTQKISWNQTNRFPHNTFWWQGIDGSRIWTHFPPADTYTGSCSPKELKKHLAEHRDHARSDHGLYVFGYGDGGGGPTAEQIEFIRRARRAPGMPQIRFGKAGDFFREAKEKSGDLPLWVGELYGEFHRGTYTTQAHNKRMNRLCEFLMRDAEYLSVMGGEPYDAAEIERLWKLVLLNQFHDILPGSSIREVYVDSAKDYEEVAKGAGKIIETEMLKIANRRSTEGFQRPVAVYKFATATSEARMPVLKGAQPQSLISDGEVLPVQRIDEFGQSHLIFAAPSSSLGSVAVCDLSPEPAPGRRRFVARSRRIENDTWAVRFDTHGNITSILSLEDHTEYIQQGKLANCFQIFEDKPLFWSAWDIDAFALETQRDLVRSERFEIVERGPVRVAAEIVKIFGTSTIKQRISLGPTPGIRFDTWIDWHESEKMLKVAFPVNVNAARATCEIQFGNVERPTHANTSWDMAKFEVCAHKWVDISEGDHGVALLNDSKYGHDIRGNVLRLTLLRSPKAPDASADMGVHRFTYSLMPHFGPYNWAGVVQAAQALNAPAHVASLPRSEGSEERTPPLVACEDRNIVIEAVKKAEDSSAIIVRLYEAHNARGTAEISVSRAIKAAFKCDLLENEEQDLEIVDGAVSFEYQPFEILTIKLAV
ncbi:MAG TPA: alpha-mannosidase [Fimbriimonadales bacterium]|jgi:alpha-mannosidase|nr:alpha-mannosidase [Fimbriimonadales bacterium]